MRHVQLPCLEGMRLGMRGDVEVARHAVDQNDATHDAPLAVDGAHLTLLLDDSLGLVGVMHVVGDERLEGLVGAVADVRLVGVRVMPPVHTHCREGVHVLVAAQLLPSRGTVRLRHHHILRVRRSQHVVVRLLPHRLQPAAPRAPRRVEVDQHQLLLLDGVEEALLLELRRDLRRRETRREHARLGVLHLLRRLEGDAFVRADEATLAVDARLDDVGGYVLQVRAHHVDNVERSEATGQVVDRHVEVDLQLLLRARVEDDRRLRVDRKVRREVSDEEVRHDDGGEERDGATRERRLC
mmetsp:Transcript_24549/g.60888  ORF Transcript_24549/g.60888 Transcript_24549/m.60888 type:complete len:297 (+) Transcript_24549:858-1748(+)